jgi:hypothetical protein
MDWEGLKTAYLDRERARLGLPSRQELEDRRLKQEMAQAAQESNLATASVQRDLARAQLEALPETQRLARGLTLARTEQARAAAERKPAERALTGDAYLTNLLAKDPAAAAKLLEFKSRLARESRPPRETYVAATDSAGNTVFAPKSQLGSGNFRPLDPNVERVRKAQAGHVVAQAEALLKDYATPEAKNVIGGMTGTLNEQRTTNPAVTIIAGQADPAYQRIRAAEASLSAFQPIMHGSRGGENMLEHFEKNIRGNPAVGVEARAAAVRALIEAAKRIQGQGVDVDLSDLEQQIGQGGAGGATAPTGGGSPADDPLGILGQ